MRAPAEPHRVLHRAALAARGVRAPSRAAAAGPRRSAGVSCSESSPTLRSSAPILFASAWIASAIGSGRWIQSASGPSMRRPSTRTGCPGLPTTVEFGRHVGDHDAVGADLRAVADRDRPEQLGAGADRDVVLHRRVALARGKARAAERDPLIERHVVADVGRLADHDAGAVIDEQALADARRRMDLDPRRRRG